jgi:hypothetical protein
MQRFTCAWVSQGDCSAAKTSEALALRGATRPLPSWTCPGCRPECQADALPHGLHEASISAREEDLAPGAHPIRQDELDLRGIRPHDP